MKLVGWKSKQSTSPAQLLYSKYALYGRDMQKVLHSNHFDEFSWLYVCSGFN